MLDSFEDRWCNVPMVSFDRCSRSEGGPYHPGNGGDWGATARNTSDYAFNALQTSAPYTTAVFIFYISENPDICNVFSCNEPKSGILIEES